MVCLGVVDGWMVVPFARTSLVGKVGVWMVMSICVMPWEMSKGLSVSNGARGDHRFSASQRN